MTFKEKWINEHPGEEFYPYMNNCPYDYGYEHCRLDEQGCIHKYLDCPDCWDREIPEENNTVIDDPMIIPGAGPLIQVDHSGHSNKPEGGVAVTFKKCDGEVTYGIKDSGDRTEFETGAVRDMREGKGRCDLMPLEVVSRYMEEVGIGVEGVMSNIARFKHSEYTDTSYLYLLLSVFCDETYEKNYPDMFLEVAKHFEEGAKKYGENNWQKGIPVYCYIDSAIRHYLKWLRGDKDEPHDRAFVWNIMCCIWEVDYREKDKEEK